FVKVNEARLVHMNYAFLSEYSDYGHNLQFKIIQDKIDACNDKLYQICESQKKQTTNVFQREEDDEETTNNEGGDENSDLKNVMREIGAFKKKQKHDERETAKQMKQYIKEMHRH